MGPRTHEIISQTTLLEPKAADPGTRGAMTRSANLAATERTVSRA